MTRLLEYLSVRTLLVGLEFVPYRTALEIARVIARTAYRLPSTPRRRCLKHLKLAYGDEIDERRAKEIARGAFETIALHVAEATQVSRRVRYKLRIENGDRLKEAYEQGRGVVLVSAHMGCFIRMIAIPKLLGLRASVIMKDQRNDRLHQWGISHLKRNFDLDVITKRNARRQVVECLREGHVLVLFADHHPREGGFPVRFFGQPTIAASGPAVYAKRFGCPMFIITAILKPDGTHVLRLYGPVSTEGTHEEVSQRWFNVLEARIRENPEQWSWMHKRWRDSDATSIQPSGAASRQSAHNSG